MFLTLGKQSNKLLFLSLKSSHSICRGKKIIVIEREKYHQVTCKLLEETATTNCLGWLEGFTEKVVFIQGFKE